MKFLPKITLGSRSPKVLFCDNCRNPVDSVLHVAGAPIRSFFRRLVRHRAGTMSVFLKSFPLKRRGSPVSLARA